MVHPYFIKVFFFVIVISLCIGIPYFLFVNKRDKQFKEFIKAHNFQKLPDEKGLPLEFMQEIGIYLTSCIFNRHNFLESYQGFFEEDMLEITSLDTANWNQRGLFTSCGLRVTAVIVEKPGELNPLFLIRKNESFLDKIRPYILAIASFKYLDLPSTGIEKFDKKYKISYQDPVSVKSKLSSSILEEIALVDIPRLIAVKDRFIIAFSKGENYPSREELEKMMQAVTKLAKIL